MPAVASLRRALRLAASFALVSLVACYIQPTTSGSGGSSDASTPGASFCANACTANQRCDSTVVLSSCEGACTNTYGAQLAHLRADFVSAWSSCLQGASCTSWQLGTSIPSCHDQAAAAFQPSPAAQTYCSEAAAKDTTCTGVASQAVCLDTAKVFDDASLAAGTNCLSQDCTQYLACTKSAFGTK